MCRLSPSQVNSDRLDRLRLQAPQIRAGAGEALTSSPGDAAQRLTDAPDGRSRHDAALDLLAALSSPPPPLPPPPPPPQSTEKRQHQGPSYSAGPEAASRLVQALVGSILPLDHVADYAAHALTAELALASLRLLSASRSCPLDDQALVSIVAYTDVRDPWTTPSSSCLAASLAASHLPADRLAQFIVGPLLDAHVRPIFSGSVGHQVIGSRRPAQLRDRPAAPPAHAQTPLWKQRDPPVMSVFGWAVESAQPSVIADNWHLFLPVLLALVEDQETRVRERGLGTLAVFLQKCPRETLHLTGIGSLFEHAVFPTLLFLPSLTPEQESAALLRLAYRVLLQLAEADPDSHSQCHRRRRSLDRLMRDGIMAGYFHASQHATIVEILMHNAAAIVSSLGIFSVKHLQSLLDIIESVMAEPFLAAAHPPALAAAGAALNALLSHCWPRISESAQHAEQMLLLMATCWLSLHDQEDESAGRAPAPDLVGICEQLLSSSRLLHSIWPGPNPDAKHKLAEALSREPRLAPLFLGRQDASLQPTSAS